MRVGNGDGFSGVVGNRSEDYTESIIVVGLGILQALHHDGANSISPAIAVGVYVPSLASIGGLREEVSLAKAGEGIRVRENIHTTGYDGIGVAAQERRASCLDSGQTGRASCVDAEARSGEFKKVVDTSRTKSTATSGDEVSADFLSSVDLSASRWQLSQLSEPALCDIYLLIFTVE
jgi:hypothetical protein